MTSESSVGEAMFRVSGNTRSLPETWSWGRLEDLCKGVYDCPHSTPKLTATGPYVVRTQDILPGVFLAASAGRVSEETYRERTIRATPRQGDLLYSREGTYFGIAAEVPIGVRVCLGQRMVLIRPDENAVNFRFLRYWLNSPIMAAYIHGFRDGSVAERLNLPTIRSLPVLIPSASEQSAIAEVLSALDGKIAVNDRIIPFVEELCRSIFCDSFSEALVSLRSGRELPAGWTVGAVGDACSVLETGRRPKGGVSGYADGVPSIGAESISRLGKFDFAKVKYVPEEFFTDMRQGILEDYDVLLYKDGGRPGNFEPHVSMFGRGFPFERMCINEHVYRIRLANPLDQAYGYFWLSSEPVMAEMRSRGTGVAIPGLNSRAVRELPVIYPTIDRLTRFNETALPMIDRALSAASESRTLAQLRDTLLPKLMSGAIRVRDAEKVVEDVT